MHAGRNNAVMLRLEFSRPAPEAAGTVSSTIGPASIFRFSNNQICRELDSEVLATFLARSWIAQGQRFTGFRCRGTSCIHFENAKGEHSRHCGPFEDVSFEEGSVRVAHGQLFAAYQEQNRLWHSFVLSSDWPTMILTAAARALPRSGPLDTASSASAMGSEKATPGTSGDGVQGGRVRARYR